MRLGEPAGGGQGQRLAADHRTGEERHRFGQPAGGHQPFGEAEERDQMRREGHPEHHDDRIERPQGPYEQQRYGQHDQRDGGRPPARRQRDPGGHQRQRESGDGAHHPHRGVDEPGLGGLVEAFGQRRDAGLAGAEDDALERHRGPHAVHRAGHAGAGGAGRGSFGAAAVRRRCGWPVGGDRGPRRPGRGRERLRCGRARRGHGRCPGRAPPRPGRRVQRLGPRMQRRSRRVQRERRAADREQQGGQGEGRGRVGHRGGQPDQGRAEHERRLVQGAFEGQRGVDQTVVGPCAMSERHEPGAGQRPDLRYGGTGEQPDQGERQSPGPGEGGGHQRGHGERIEPAGRQHHRPLPVPVGEPAEQRPAHRLTRRQRTADQTRGGQRAARPCHQQQTAELAHGRGEPAEEGDDGQHRPAQGHHPAIGGRCSDHRQTLSGTGPRTPGTGRTKVHGLPCRLLGGSDDTNAGRG